MEFRRDLVGEVSRQDRQFLFMFTPTSLTTSCNNPCTRNGTGAEAPDVL